MITVHDDIVDMIESYLVAHYDRIYVTADYEPMPSKFPSVWINEEDNYTTPAHMDTSDNEKYATVVYTFNVFSNKVGKKRAECRSIMSDIDTLMYRKNFTRIETDFVTMESTKVCRMACRYRAETDGENIYRIR